MVLKFDHSAEKVGFWAFSNYCIIAFNWRLWEAFFRTVNAQPVANVWTFKPEMVLNVFFSSGSVASL